MSVRARAVLTLAAVLGATALSAAPAGAASAKPVRVTVMTRNLYLGMNLYPLVGAAPGGPFEAAARAGLDAVRATEPALRMQLVAREIAAARPDLVGLQEASVWQTTSTVGNAATTTTVANYLAAIMAELKRLHAPYRIVARQLTLHIRAPLGGGVQVHFNDGNAILARAGVSVRHVRSADFSHLLTIPVQALGPVVATRSWNALDASVRGATFHFVNAHLEDYSTDTRLQQARELVSGPLRSPLTTILVGDLNSNANLPKPADRPPYLAIRAAGFAEERTPQFNCCLKDDLRSGVWDHIVDHIMAKPAVKLVRSFITGRETTPSGMRPSDHGGVVSVLQLRR